MKILLKTSIIILCLFISHKELTAQEILQTHNPHILSVFGNSSNLRNAPNINATIIGSGNEGEILASAYQSVKDTIDGYPDYWHKIVHNNQPAYIWGGITSDADIKSQVYPNHRFLIKQLKSDSILVKCINLGGLKKTFKFPIDANMEFIDAKSLGTTYNSNNADIFAFCFTAEDSIQTQLYQWNGNKLDVFNKYLKVNSFISYSVDTTALILDQLVNFRSKPNTNSSVLKVLGFNYSVTPVRSYRKKYDTVNGEYGSWTKVVYNLDTGYVWSSYLSSYQFTSYKQEGLTFAIRRKRFSYDEIVAIKDGQLLDSYKFQPISNNFAGAHSMGNMGVSNLSELIGVCYLSYSCGQGSGDQIIAWNGKRFKKFFCNSGVGDGGLSFGHSVAYPLSQKRGKEIITIHQYDSESIKIYNSDIQRNYANINRIALPRNYIFNGDSLQEIESETTKLEKLLAIHFPKYSLAYFESGDVNADGFSDYVLNVRYSAYDYYEYENEKHKSLVIVFLNNQNDSFQLSDVSKSVIEHDKNDPLSSISIIDNGFLLNIYYAGYSNEHIDNSQYQITFKYDSISKHFYVKKEVLNELKNEKWKQNTVNYNQKKLMFETSHFYPG